MQSVTFEKRIRLINKRKCDTILRQNTVTVNGKDISKIIIVCDEKGYCYINDSLTHKENNIFLVALAKCHTENNRQQLAEENIKQKQSILREMLRSASTCANVELYASARKDYERALNLIAEHPFFDEFLLTENEYISIMYACAQCNIRLDTFEGIIRSMDMYNNLLQKWGNKFPCLYFSKAYALHKLDYIEEALAVVEEGLIKIDNCKEMSRLYWPTTDKAILDSEPDELRLKLVTLRKTCLCPRQYDGICAFCGCQQPSKYIYFDGLAFAGCTVVICSRACKFIYHPNCWKKHLKDHGMYPKNCITNACEGFITSVKIIDKDQREKTHLQFQDPSYEEKDKSKPQASKSDAEISSSKSDSQKPAGQEQKDKNATQSSKSDVEISSSKSDYQNPPGQEQKDNVTQSSKSDVEISSSKSDSENPPWQEQSSKSDVKITSSPKSDSQNSPSQEEKDNVIQSSKIDEEIFSSKSDSQNPPWQEQKNKDVTQSSKSDVEISSSKSEQKDKNVSQSSKRDVEITSSPKSDSQNSPSQEQKDKNVTQSSKSDVEISSSPKSDSQNPPEQKYNNEKQLSKSDFKITCSTNCDTLKMLSDNLLQDKTEDLNSPSTKKVDVATQENLNADEQDKRESELRALKYLREENDLLKHAMREADNEYNALVIAYKQLKEAKSAPAKTMVETATQTSDDIKVELQNLKYQLQYTNQDRDKLVQENRSLKYNLNKSRNEIFALQNTSDKKITHFAQELRDLSSFLVNTKREKESLEQTNQVLINLMKQQMQNTAQILSSYLSSYQAQCNSILWELRNISAWLTNESIPSEDDVKKELNLWTNKLAMASSHYYSVSNFYRENISKLEAGDLNNLEVNCPMGNVFEEHTNLMVNTYRILVARNRQLELEVSHHILTLYNQLNNQEMNSLYSMVLKDNQYLGDEKKLKAIYPNTEPNVSTQVSTERARTPVSDENIKYFHTKNNQSENIDANEHVPKVITASKTTTAVMKVTTGSNTSATDQISVNSNTEKSFDVVGQEALIIKLKELFPMTSEPTLKEALEEVRSTYGGLSGWSSHDITEAMRHTILKIKKSKEMTSIKQMKETKKDICTVCKDYIKSDESTKLRCDHIFHTKCIKIWLRNHDMCPICKEVAFFEKRKY